MVADKHMKVLPVGGTFFVSFFFNFSLKLRHLYRFNNPQ